MTTQSAIILTGVNYLTNADSFVGQELTLAIDSDNDSKPDILDFDGVEQLHALNSAESIDAAIPFMVWYDTLPFFESADAFTVQLTAGTDYTLEFSRNFTDSLGARSPHFEVTGPDGVILSPDVFTLSLYPRETPAVICYTLTPETSGQYSITVMNADPNLSDDVATDSVLFVYEEMHNEDGENGYPSRFKLADGAGTVDVRNIIQLRKIILENNPDYIDYLSGKMTAAPSMNDDTEEFDHWLGVLTSNAGTYDDGRVTASGTIIPEVVNGIPYDSRYSIGTGVLATSDLSTFDTVIKSEQLILSGSQGKETLFKYDFISSVEDYERNISGKADISLSYASVTGSANASYTNNYKFGQTSITFLIHYEELESFYRELDTSKCELKDEAVNILNQGSDNFRREYGDYFVAGYQYGGVYNAFITITTQTREQANDINASVHGKYDNKAMSVDVDIAFSLRDAAKRNNASVTVEVRTAGANDNLPDMKVMTGVDAINEVVSQLGRSNIAKAFTPDSYSPVMVRMKRYRTLSGARSKLAQSIHLSPNDFANIAKLNSAIIAMHGYRNTIEGIPNDHINSNAKSRYLERCSNIITRIRSTGNMFYEDADQIRTTLNETNTLKNDMQALADRYVFYRMLITAQNREPRGFFPQRGYTYSGYESCAWSDVCPERYERRNMKLGGIQV